MRSVPAILLFAVSLTCSLQAHAQLGPGCGPANIKFDVSTTKAQPSAVTPPSGKALVYFLQDDFKYDFPPRPTTRFGIDGTWIGATHANSYFYVFVDPGDHDACASWQSGITKESRPTAAAHFTAQAGHVYYFRAQDIYLNAHGGPISPPEVKLSLLDSDEAQVLINSFSFSSSHPKK